MLAQRVLEQDGLMTEQRLADAHAAEPLHVRQPVEVEDALDQVVGVLHLVDRLVVEVLPQALVSPVLEHAAVEEVLVDRRELGRQDLVEQVDDLRVSLHGLHTTAPRR